VVMLFVLMQCSLIGQLPANHRLLLSHVVQVLVAISENSNKNRMTADNIGRCLGPTLLWPPQESEGRGTRTENADEYILRDSARLSLVVERLIQGADVILGDDRTSTSFDDVIAMTSPPSKRSIFNACSSLDDSDGPIGIHLKNKSNTKSFLSPTIHSSFPNPLTSAPSSLYSHLAQPARLPFFFSGHPSVLASNSRSVKYIAPSLWSNLLPSPSMRLSSCSSQLIEHR
jgi:hypothetical protein